MSKHFILLISCALSISAQTHPYSNAWAHVTSTTTNDLQFTATTVAGTGGTDTHTMSQVAVFIESPSARTASAYNYPAATTGQATAYLSLCGTSGCEDGTFNISSVNTTEFCGATSQVLTLAVQTSSPQIQPWVTLQNFAFTPNQVEWRNRSTTATVSVVKSASCNAASVDVEFSSTASPLALAYSPASSTGTATFSGTSASKGWTVTTDPNNNHTGTISGTGALSTNGGCSTQGPITKQASVQVVAP